MRQLRNPRAVDALTALAFLAAGVADVAGGTVVGPRWANLLAAAAVPAALLLRRRAPVGAALLFFAVLFAQAIWLTPPPELIAPFFGFLFFPYAAAVHGTARGALVVLAGIPVTVVAVNLIVGAGNPVGDALFPTVIGTGCLLIGRAVRSRLELAAELHEAALLALEEEEAEAARAVLEERRRIAREMHDVVAHSISVMVVQAGGGRRILASDPPRAVAAATEIEREGRDALVEMRRLLGALHPREGGPAMAPQPGLEGLPALLDRARAAGLPVQLHVAGEPRPLPPGVDLAIYRILQEALTNALKHSGPSATDVHLRWGEGAVELEVLDAGVAGNSSGDGAGLIGMQERVRLYGGELHAGRRREGGFAVRARIPFTTEETQ